MGAQRRVLWTCPKCEVAKPVFTTGSPIPPWITCPCGFKDEVSGLDKLKDVELDPEIALKKAEKAALEATIHAVHSKRMEDVVKAAEAVKEERAIKAAEKAADAYLKPATKERSLGDVMAGFGDRTTAENKKSFEEYKQHAKAVEEKKKLAALQANAIFTQLVEAIEEDN